MKLDSITSLATANSPNLPVVIPTFNNPSYLKMMVGQLTARGLFDLVVVDNNSTIEGMSELLDELSSDFTVIKKKTNDGPTEFYKNKDFYSWLPRWFVITDPDIGFNKNLPEDFIEVMKELSDRFNTFRTGFALDIEMEGIESNIKEIMFIPARKSMYEWECQFWREHLGVTKYGDAVYGAALDTTFCLVDKSKNKGDYYKPSIRIAGRFTAQHYGWYKNPPIKREENEFYLSAIPKHWSETGNAIKKRKEDALEEKWDGSWRFNYLGAFIQQNPKALDVFKKFFEQNKFETVVEIGTANGGLSMMLKDECDKMGAKFETYDIKEDSILTLNKNENFKNRNIKLFVCDVLSEANVKSLGARIKNGGRVLLLCDGGNKIREFNTYSTFLKKDDVIMAHDYAEDKADFENNVKNKVWNWHEIGAADIHSACESHRLQDYHPEFRSVAWVCKIKQ